MFCPAYISRASTGVEINEQVFPDANFRKYVKDTFDGNKDDILSAEEIQNITCVIVPAYLEVRDFQGIENFPELERLHVDCRWYSSGSDHKEWSAGLDVRYNIKLKKLECFMAEIEGLDLRENPMLEELSLSGVKETVDLSQNVNLKKISLIGKGGDIDLSQNLFLEEIDLEGTFGTVDLSQSKKLKKINLAGGTIKDSSGNFMIYPELEELTLKSSDIILEKILLSGLGALKTVELGKGTIKQAILVNCQRLEEFSGTGCSLEEINLSGCDHLRILNCAENQLKELNVGKGKELREISCHSNRLVSLDLSACKKLEKISAEKNKLRKLKLCSGTKINWLNIKDNDLRKLDLRNIKVGDLFCSNNKLTKLKVNKAIESLYCSNNKLKMLNLSGCKKIKEISCSRNQLKKLNLKNCKALYWLQCSRNKLKTLDVTSCNRIYILDCRKNKIKKIKISRIGKLGLDLKK